eukprot:GAHX01001271.1.p1 GENE.GAHX01001271.1~~GAHX01001271.1.p1  ORF type:complete len:437 (-),score=82.47 GAHX01001271.1:82-1350(-)
MEYPEHFETEGPTSLSSNPGGFMTYLSYDAYSEAFLKTKSPDFINSTLYSSLVQSANLQDLKICLSESIYGDKLAELVDTVTASNLSNILHSQLTEEFFELKECSSDGLKNFFTFIQKEKMIKNMIYILRSIIKAKKRNSLSSADDASTVSVDLSHSSEELVNLKKILHNCNFLGIFKQIRAVLTIDNKANLEDLYNTILIESPISDYFSRLLNTLEEGLLFPNIMNAHTSPLYNLLVNNNIDILETALYKYWIEDFYSFCCNHLNSETKNDMKLILETIANHKNVCLLYNSLETNLSINERNRIKSRKELFINIGDFEEYGTDRFDDVTEESDLKKSLEDLVEYNKYIQESMDKEIDLEEVLEKIEEKKYKLLFWSSSSYAPFYCWVKMKEQEIKNIKFIANCIEQGVDINETVKDWNVIN